MSAQEPPPARAPVEGPVEGDAGGTGVSEAGPTKGGGPSPAGDSSEGHAEPLDAGSCPKTTPASIGWMVVPPEPRVGESFRIAVATLSFEDPLSMRVESEAPATLEITRRVGIPSSLAVRVTAKASGLHRVVVGRGGQGVACFKVEVGPPLRVPRSAPVRPRSEVSLWPLRRAWTIGEEALFAAWIRELFTAEVGDDVAFRALHEVTSDPARNLLHGALGWGEDDRRSAKGLRLDPDCADTPYFLRAYFAWKRGLPFGYRQCSRGHAGRPPACGEVLGMLGPSPHGDPPGKTGELAAVQEFLRRTVKSGVHSGNGRVPFEADASDFYPVRLERRSLRPGVIFADPYGHILILVEWVAPRNGAPGVLYAIDGQPDGSITRKRFWEGNFLWNPDPTLGGSGWKAFRPLLYDRDEGRLEALDNASVARHPGYADFSSAQASLDAAAFYDQMEALITPGVVDPRVALDEAIVSLFEAAKVRVTSVENGRRYVQAHPNTIIEMPTGPRIFETTGAWEDYATPSRDLRLLVALHVVLTLEEKVARQPARFGLGDAAAVARIRSELASRRRSALDSDAYAFSYVRTDGSTWTLRLADLVARATALEVGYNPNDCPETRFGAPVGSQEHATCDRVAPEDQRRKLAEYRAWFRERTRPARR